MPHSPSIVEQMDAVAQRLSDAFQQDDPFSQALTDEVVSYVRTLDFKRQPDGSAVLKTPVMQDKRALHAFAEVVNRGLGYLGLDLDARNARVAHSDVMKDITLQAKRDNIETLFSAATHADYDCIEFKVTPEDMRKAQESLKNDERGLILGRMLEMMKPKEAPQQRPAAVIHL